MIKLVLAGFLFSVRRNSSEPLDAGATACPRLLQDVLEGEGLRRQLHRARKDVPEGTGMRMRRMILVASLICVSAPAAADPSCGLYQYNAVITEVYDGDTVTADIDLGFNTWRRDEGLRLAGVDTPELRGVPDEVKARGLAARDALRERILGKHLIICTIKDRQGKYGRYLVNIWDGDELVNDWLIEAGHAFAYDGGSRVQ